MFLFVALEEIGGRVVVLRCDFNGDEIRRETITPYFFSSERSTIENE